MNNIKITSIFILSIIILNGCLIIWSRVMCMKLCTSPLCYGLMTCLFHGSIRLVKKPNVEILEEPIYCGTSNAEIMYRTKVCCWDGLGWGERLTTIGPTLYISIPNKQVETWTCGVMYISGLMLMDTAYISLNEMATTSIECRVMEDHSISSRQGKVEVYNTSTEHHDVVGLCISIDYWDALRCVWNRIANNDESSPSSRHQSHHLDVLRSKDGRVSLVCLVAPQPMPWVLCKSLFTTQWHVLKMTSRSECQLWCGRSASTICYSIMWICTYKCVECIFLISEGR